MDKVEQFDRFNFLKGGVVYSDILTTVSRKYAEEIQTAEFGEQIGRRCCEDAPRTCAGF